MDYYNINTPNNDVKHYINVYTTPTSYHFPAIDIQRIYLSFQNNNFNVKLKMGANPIIDSAATYSFGMSMAINDSCSLSVFGYSSIPYPVREDFLKIEVLVQNLNSENSSYASGNTTPHVDGHSISWSINFTQFYPLINVKNFFVPANLKNLSKYTGIPIYYIAVEHSLIY